MSAAPRRLALPLVLLILAVALAGVTVALRWDQARAGSAEPVTGGGGGVAARLADGAVYEVYADGDSVAIDDLAGSSCVVNPRGGTSQGTLVTLQDDRSDAPDITRDGTTFVYLGSFTSLLAGDADVTCRAAADKMLLDARGTAFLPWPVLLGIGALLFAAVVAWVLGRRRTSA